MHTAVHGPDVSMDVSCDVPDGILKVLNLVPIKAIIGKDTQVLQSTAVGLLFILF